jgi:adenosylmethionine-8-amino-7-oxononanoate aminotransferase
MSKQQKSLREKDREYVWHPLTQHKTSGEMMPLARAQGALLFDPKDKAYIDGISSWYTAVYGHCHPEIIGAVRAQMETLDQVVFSGFTHRPAVNLAEKLLAVLPGQMSKVFYSDNGSTATEIGIKMALQYHFNRGEKRPVLLAFEEGFHGDTFGAMSVSGLSVYNGPFEDFFLEVQRLPVPTEENKVEVLNGARKLLAENKVAGFIYEPLVQGAAAMRMYSASGLDDLLGLMKEQDVICIADEVMTGFGKTGELFASSRLRNQPDIICLSKALTAGMVPMAVTACKEKIYQAFYHDEIGKGFFHGHTYTANPLACVAARRALELLQSPEIQEGIRRIRTGNELFAAEMRSHPKVTNVRTMGVIFALDLKIEMDRYGDLRDKIYQAFMERGVFLRPLGKTIYTLPPYVTTIDQLEAIFQSIREVVDTI